MPARNRIPGSSALPISAVSFAVAALASLAPASFAQPYPAKPVRIVVPFGAGGPSDLLARAVGQKLAEAWGQQVLIDNRGGANGMVGAEVAARSAPDGYTLLLGTNGTHGMNSSLFAKVPYDPVRDFAPIVRIAAQHFLLVAHPSLPVRSVRELIALARARPGEIVWACGGAPTQLGAELFRKEANVNVIVVPYKGNAPAVTATMSGEASLVLGGAAQSAPLVRAGRLRALGIAGPRRSAVLPEVPTVSESGVPGFEAGAWYGFLAPAATPPQIVERVNGEVTRILKLPDIQARLRADAFEVPGDTPDAFAAAIRAEVAKWPPIVKAAGIPVQ
ncbi:MAG: tripartite tricarboxylate transporter substrate binding protein [Burkholderiales bacterium]|nr:tripartite tricarboxylate transporter substrate binding protein [Burkholderiales bacterium]